MQIIDEINSIVSKEAYFEFEIFSYSKNKLTVVGSRDFLYFHNMEIYFIDVFSIIGNLTWHVDTSNKCLCLIDNYWDLVTKYDVEIGYKIFEFKTEDSASTYVIAKDITYEMKDVKYYE